MVGILLSGVAALGGAEVAALLEKEERWSVTGTTGRGEGCTLTSVLRSHMRHHSTSIASIVGGERWELQAAGGRAKLYYIPSASCTTAARDPLPLSRVHDRALAISGTPELFPNPRSFCRCASPPIAPIRGGHTVTVVTKGVTDPGVRLARSRQRRGHASCACSGTRDRRGALRHTRPRSPTPSHCVRNWQPGWCWSLRGPTLLP